MGTHATDQSLHTVVIIGSGFGGLATAIALDRAGVDYQILERRTFMGGTWVQNAYPGAAVDVQSPLYSLSFEPYDWTRMFAHRSELVSYTNHLISKYDLKSRTRTGCTVIGLEWCDEDKVWQVRLHTGETVRARFVVNASGALSTPVIPDFPGREQFAGPAFHTNAWDQTVDLRGKRVAVIGSGASAAQVIPAIAGEVDQLHVFQRTPHWVLPRPDRVFSDRERSWLRRPWFYRLVRTLLYWRLESRLLAFKYFEWLLFVLGERHGRALLKAQVADEALRARLTPDYRIGCKRILVSNDLYPALCQENTTLWTREQGIGRITEHGIVTMDGESIELDVIVYATGYDATDGLISYPVTGRQGATLGDAWAEFPRAYLGTTVPGFPNLFILTGPNTGIGHTSALFVIESQIRYVLDAIMGVLAAGARAIEVTADAEETWTGMVHREMRKTVWHWGGCSSWYQGRGGRVIAIFPGFSFVYRWLTRRADPASHQVTP